MSATADEVRRQIIELHLLGHPQTAIAEATGVAQSTVSRTVHSPEAQAVLAAEAERAAAESTRARERRISRVHSGPEERVVTSTSSGSPSTSKADGRLLGTISFAQPGAALHGYTTPRALAHGGQDHVLETESYSDWIARKTKERDLPLDPKEVPCRATTPTSSYTYFLELEDIARLSAILAEETGLAESDLRTLLSETPPGGTVALDV